MSDIAEYLTVDQNTATEIVGRACGAGLVTRERDPDDRRVVRVRLTEEGRRKIDAVTALTIRELDGIEDAICAFWRQ